MIKYKCVFYLLNLFVLLIIPSTGIALTQAEIESGAAQAKDISQREEENRKKQFKKDRERKGAETQINIDSNPLPEEKEEAGVCHVIKNIIIRKNTLLSKRNIDKHISAYKGKCLGVNSIQRLLGSLTNEYIERGYITTRVYLPAQNLLSGQLIIEVEEGRVENIKQQSKKSFSIGGAFPIKKGDILNLRDIEQGLDQVNRLGSNSATMSIIPGKKPGESEIVVENTPSKRWSINVSTDNHGSKSTGKEQLSFTGSVDNPLNINDYFSITYKKSLNASPNKPWKINSSKSFSYIVPYGYNTFTVGASDSSYKSTLTTTSGERLKLSGTSNSSYAQIERTVYRNKRDKLKLSIKGTVKDTKSYLSDQLLNVSSRKLSIADINLNWKRQLSYGDFSVDLGVSKGVEWFSSLEDPDNLLGDFPHAQFKKINLAINHNANFPIMGKPGQLKTTFQSQTTDDVLYGSEQITIGGLSSVRGFENTTLSGDDGYYLRNDLSISTQIKKLPGVIQPYVAFDVGFVNGESTDAIQGSLAGAAVGVKYSGKKFQAELSHATALNKPQFSEKETGNTTYFSLGMNF